MSTLPTKISQPSASPLLGWLLIPLGLLGVLFSNVLINLVSAWRTDDNYSHGFLVLPISIYLAVRYVRSTKEERKPELFIGALEMLLGISMLLVSQIIPYWLLHFGAFLLVLQGIAVAIGGQKWARGFLFPLLFLFFMFPMPEVWTGLASLWLQDWVAWASAGVLDALVGCTRLGTQLSVSDPTHQKFHYLQVAEECSGLRQIVTFVALGSLLCYWNKKTHWIARLLLLLLAVPVAILANTARVTIMGIGAVKFGTKWMDGWLHHAPALFTLPLGLVLYFGIASLLRPFGASKNEDDHAEK